MKNRFLISFLIFIFTIFSIVYFWYGFSSYVPKKVTEVGKTFITNESIRHILKVSILNEKAYNSLLISLKKQDDDLLYESIDFMEASFGFLQAFELIKYPMINELKDNINNSIKLIESKGLNLTSDDLKKLLDNRNSINIIVEDIEKVKWEKLHSQVVHDETKKFNVIVVLIYVIIFSLILIVIILTVIKKKSILEKEKIRDQRLLLNQSKVAAVGEMLGNIAHQWRQPLSVITTLVSGVKFSLEFNGKVEKKDLEECADVVLKQAQYLSKTIDDFRHFFMSDNNALSLISIKKVMEDLESLTKSIFKSNFIKIDIKVKEDFEIYSNESILIQSFINICNNSKDAFLEKNIDTSNRFFLITVDKKNDYFHIELTDSAGGIKKDVMDRIFEPYFTTKHKSLGTGIGLYMTHQLITKQCQGEILVENVEFDFNDKKLSGVKFIIKLPLYQQK